MRNKNTIYHVLFWLGIYFLWILLFRSYSVSLTKTITIEFCYLIFVTLDYYAISNFIIPRFLHEKKHSYFIGSALLVIAFSSWLRTLVALQMNLHVFQTKRVMDFGTIYLNSLVNISLWVLLVTIGKMLVERIQTQQQLELLARERVKNELNYLKAQINPHALFNSLNTIYGHIDKTNQVTRNILLHFSELLRYQLYDCGAEKVILEREVEYITNYVAFQRLRKSDNLCVNVEIINIEPGLKIAPLLLVVLIENAFKFVSNYSDRQNKINISIGTTGKTLHCSFCNTKEMQVVDASTSSNGIGIVNLKRRLELLYPQKFALTTNVSNDIYESQLTIELT